MTRSFQALAVVAALLLALAGCGKQKDTGFNNLPRPKATTGGADTGVKLVAGNKFDPETFTAKVGDTVTWTYDDSSGQPHNVVSDTGLFDSHPDCQKDAGKCMSSGTYTFTFAKAGSYPYYCVLHGSKGGFGMSGVVVVK